MIDKSIQRIYNTFENTPSFSLYLFLFLSLFFFLFLDNFISFSLE